MTSSNTAVVQLECAGPRGEQEPDEGEFLEVLSLSISPPKEKNGPTVVQRLEQLAKSKGAIIDAKLYTFAMGLDMARAMA